MDLILHSLTPMHWAVGGAIIAAVTVTLLVVGGRQLGFSTGFEDLCAIAVDVPYFRRAALLDGRAWRLLMLGGLVLGGLVSALLAGGWEPIWDLGRFDEVIGWGNGAKLLWMFGGGLLIGFGTRLAGGCTSGHGIFGVSHLEPGSLIATASFMAAGVVTTNLIYRALAA